MKDKNIDELQENIVRIAEEIEELIKFDDKENIIKKLNEIRYFCEITKEKNEVLENKIESYFDIIKELGLKAMIKLYLYQEAIKLFYKMKKFLTKNRG